MQSKLPSKQIKSFQELVWTHYKKHARKLPWRGTTNPYHIVVSEIMLQQTQVTRVLVKYEEFISQFPTWQTLADASLGDVLRVWQGLGYNRRAKYLHETAKIVAHAPKHLALTAPSVEYLTSLPGIGQNTAGAILAYAFNVPCVFLETNIKAVYIHHFFKNKQKVSDAELLPLVEQTMDTKKPREWFNALMDYGGMIKRTHGNTARQSKGHIVQSKFRGSRRELRGSVLRAVLTQTSFQLSATAKFVHKDLGQKIENKKLREIIAELRHEKLLD